MGKKEKKKKIIQKLQNRYRLIIYNDSTFQTVWSTKLSRLKVFSIGGFGGLLLIFLTALIIIYTPIRELIPGYPTGEVRNMIVRNVILVDSLEEQIHIRDNYLGKIKALIHGEVPVEPEANADSNIRTGNIEFEHYDHDSIFKQKLLAEQLDISNKNGEQTSNNIASIHFFTPLKGMISQKFDESTDHFAIDIVGLPNSRISSVLEGTVIFSGWTVETGHVIYLQHPNDLISVYKHNAELLKKQHDHVKAGEAIAIMGNTGELSSGPHLHFELWHKGIALDPEQYIDF